MSLYAKYETDAAAVNDGTDVQFDENVTVRLRSIHSHEVRSCQRKLAQKSRKLYMRGGGTLSPADEDRQEVEVCAKAIIVGWSGVTDRSGASLPFSVDAARQVLTDLPDFRRDIVLAASMSETFRATSTPEEVDAAGEGSPPASAPVSGGSSGGYGLSASTETVGS